MTGHRPVLVEAIVSCLVQRPGGVFLDATVGAGGHTRAILASAGSSAQVIALDQDEEALALAAETLQGVAHQVMFRHGNFDRLGAILDDVGVMQLDGIVMDLGFSSMQVDTPRRGFSVYMEGPLDMRMDPTQPLTAGAIVNRWSEDELATLIARHGQERWARRIARAIVQARPLPTTTALATCVTRACPRQRRWSRIHPATRTFQALRIAVNWELEALEAAIPQGIARLRPAGRMAIVAYHSLEDRIVKQAFRTAAATGQWTVLTRKPVRPSRMEIVENPRARSARLRAGERTG